MAESETENPRATSSDFDASISYWNLVNAILSGAEAMRATSVRTVPGPQVPYANLSQLNRGRTAAQSPYLPQFPNESNADYDIRRKHAPFTNIYGDIARNLSSKPFSKKLDLAEESGDDLKALAENIDGQGNNLHVFARETFKAGLDKAIDWILVDHTKVPAGVTLADERSMGARPYWVHIPAERMLAVYSRFINGQEIIVHARIHEPCEEQSGYAESHVERVRILNREPLVDRLNNVVDYESATWEIWEEVEAKDSAGKDTKTWTRKDGGPITIGIIPLVPYLTGKRAGTSWRVDPPLRDLAFMQVEEFQQESNLKAIKELTAFPMLAGNGVPVPVDEQGAQIMVPVGPRAVLFAPPGGDGNHGTWTFIEPTAASLAFLQSDLEKLRTEMRDLGMQPLTTANLTVITTGQVAVKANSAVQAWAIGLKDTLEQAWKITCLWLGQKLEPTVNVHTDFGVELEAGKELESLLKAEGQGVLSKRTVQDEFKRRGVLSDDFDPDEEEQKLAEQQQGLEPEQPIDPRTGKPLNVDPLTGRPMPPANGGGRPLQ